MPRYHFHIRENDRLIRDEEGQEFPDSEAARKEALETGASIARDAFMSGSASLVIVDVQREDQTCLKVSISLSVED
jgi:Domain of unknown function (DUF6894)